MATYFKPTKIARWSGTLDEIVELSGSVAREIQARTGQPARYAARIEGPSLNAEFSALEEVSSSVRAEDLKGIEKISITVGEWAEHAPLSASIVFSRVSGEPAVVAQTRGTDRVQVEGLLSVNIQPYLDRGKRRLNLSNHLLYVLSMLLLVSVFAIWFSVPIDYPDVSFGVGYFVGSIVGGIVGFMIFWGVERFARWIYPPLELLAPGETTQFARSRKWVYSGVGGAIVVPLLLSVLTSVLTGGD